MSVKTSAFLLFGGVFGFYFVTYNGYSGVDGEILYQLTESIAERGSIEVSNAPLVSEGTVAAPDGRRYSWYQPAQSVLSVPLYLASKWLLAPLPGNPEMKKRFGVMLFAPLSASAAVAVFFLALLRLGYPRRSAIYVAVLLAFATILWPYSKRYYREAFLALGVVAVLHAGVAEVQSGRTRWAWAAGVWIGVLMLTKSVFGILLPFVWGALSFEYVEGRLRPRARFMSRSLALGIPAALGFGGLLAYNEARFGSLFNFGEPVHFSTPLIVGLHGFLFSPGRSIFFYSPILCLAVLGAGAMWRRDPLRSAVVTGACAAFLLLHCKLSFPRVKETFGGGGGACWGPRYMVPIVPVLLLPIAEWLRVSRSRFLVATFVTASVLVQLLAVLVYNRATIGPRMVKDLTLDDEDFDPRYCPIREHFLALFELKFDRVDASTAHAGQERHPAFRVKNDGITCWWMFAYRWGMSPILLLTPLLLVPCGLVLYRVWCACGP